MSSPDQIVLDLQILIEELCGIGHIRPDPSDSSSRYDHILRMELLIKSHHSNLVCEIEFKASSSDNMGISLTLETTNNSTSDETCTTSYIDFCIFFHKILDRQKICEYLDLFFCVLWTITKIKSLSMNELSCRFFVEFSVCLLPEYMFCDIS